MNPEEEREFLARLLKAGKFLDERDSKAIEAYLRGEAFKKFDPDDESWPRVQFIQIHPDGNGYTELHRAVREERTRLMPPPKDAPLPTFNEEDEEAAKSWGIKL